MVTMEAKNTGSLDASIYACTVLSVSIAAIFVALRFYTRWRLVRMIGAEDWLILFSLLLSLGSSISLCIRKF
jgi:hypothetical protein